MPSSISGVLEPYRPDLSHYEALYRHFHANPELSFQEHDTAAKIHDELSHMGEGWEIFPNIGRTGLAALLENGPGSVILLRADIDGLPVAEKTGLEYASVKKMLNLEGIEKPVMHVCL
jgi:metal-dependent amidase/aminoacylase/carboxypeptidase family protein